MLKNIDKQLACNRSINGYACSFVVAERHSSFNEDKCAGFCLGHLLKGFKYLINGLFETDYSPDSTVEYHRTEFMDDTLKRILADTILTIDGKYSYHIEAQMTKDDSIIFRVFEYGFSHANRHGIQKDDYYELPFPEPKIIYLCPEPNLPEQYTLRLNFGSQGYFDYKVNTCCFSKISTQELNDKKMVILIPFNS